MQRNRPTPRWLRWLRPVARAPAKLEQVPGFVLIGLGILVIVLGLAGYSIQNRESEQPRTLSQVTYLVAQLFALQSGLETPDNWPLSLARNCAVLLLLLGVMKVLMAAFRDTFERWRLWGLSGHDVIFGLGRVGMQLARDLSAQGKAQQLVVIERDDSNQQMLACRELGAVVLTGDATRTDLLERAALNRAGRVFAVCGSDSTNVETAVEVCRLMAAGTAPRQLLPCYVHITDLNLSELFKQQPLFRDRTDKVDVTVFNVLNSTARHLIRECLAQDRPTGEQVAHYIVFGFGQMGQSFAQTTANLAHYENLKRPRMTIIDEQVDVNRDQFLCRCPRFCPEPGTLDLSKTIDDSWSSKAFRPPAPYRADEPVAVEYACNAEFLRMPPDVESDELVEKLLLRLTQPGVRTAVVVCQDDDRRNFETAVRLCAKLRGRVTNRVPIYAWLPEQARLADLLRTDSPTAAAVPNCSIVPFGEREKTCNLQEVLRPGLEERAKAIHQVFHDRHDPTGPAWDELDETFRVSNRMAADHIEIKLAALGFETYAIHGHDEHAGRYSFNQQEVELLAQMEHNRWMAERLLDGWSYAVTKDTQRKRRPGMCSWDHVGADQNKDREQIRGIPDMLAMTGLGIRRKCVVNPQTAG